MTPSFGPLTEPVAPMILIVSASGDATAGRIHGLIRDEDVDCEWIDFDAFPGRDRMLFRIDTSGERSRRFRWDGRWIDLDSVTSILWRRPSKLHAPPELADAETREYVDATLREAIAGLFEDLPCLQVPAPRQFSHTAHLKIPQLALAASLGFEVPPTLVTNVPEEVLSFHREHDGHVIVKPVGVFLEPSIRGARCGYARLPRPRELASVRDVELCPFIAQAYVDKRMEVRATVVGSDLFAVEIHSQSTQRTRVDWRHYDEAATPHFVHDLPEDVRALCSDMVKEMGLVYGAIDLILTPDGRYVFIEINPNGQYLWLEELTGLPISQRMARLLIDGR